jgi:hypothetical protein
MSWLNSSNFIIVLSLASKISFALSPMRRTKIKKEHWQILYNKAGKYFGLADRKASGAKLG